MSITKNKFIIERLNKAQLYKLRLNSYKLSWNMETEEYLFHKLLDELFEFKQELNKKKRSKKKILNEGADIANFIAMIIDNAYTKEDYIDLLDVV